jgi:hypothetical protein
MNIETISVAKSKLEKAQEKRIGIQKEKLRRLLEKSKGKRLKVRSKSSGNKMKSLLRGHISVKTFKPKKTKLTTKEKQLIKIADENIRRGIFG